MESAIVLGHSMGGKTAMQFAVTYPERVRKLIIADIAPKPYPPHHQVIIDALLTLDFDRITSRKEADTALGAHIPEFGIRQFLLKNLFWIAPEKLGLRCNLDVLKNRMTEVGAIIDATKSYHGPCLFIKGGKSGYVLPSDLPEIQRQFPNAQFETVENAGHWLHAENPKSFFEKTSDFLNS